MSMIPVGGWGAGASRWPLPPRSPTSSSWTTLTTCWAGVSDLRTSWPTAFSRTRSTKARTTLKLTSASRRATRTSRRASWMFSSVRRPRPPRRSKIDCKRVLRESSMEIPTLRNHVRNSKPKAVTVGWGSQRGMSMSNRSLAVVAIVVGVVAPAWGQVGRPNTFTFPPGPITQPPPTANHPLNNPHPMQPWDPLWTTHFSYGGYGGLFPYIPVPPQQAAIQVLVPLPESAPPPAQARTCVTAPARSEGPHAPTPRHVPNLEHPA